MARFLEKKSFQEFLLTDGIKNGYVWKEGVNPTTGQPWSPGITHPPEFMPLKAGSEQTMGQLEGVHVVPELAWAYRMMTSREVQNETDKFLGKVAGWTLSAKTRMSVVGTERNFLGNALINMANGNFLKSLPTAGQTVKADLLGRGSDEIEKKLQRATELRVVGESVNANVLKALLGDVKKIKSQRPYLSNADAVWEVSKNIASRTGGKISQIYQAADDFWKIYSWDSEMAKLRWAYQGTVPESQIEEEAAKTVIRTTPTYSEAWAASKFFTSGPGKYLAPFIMFKLEMLRSTIGIGRQAWEELHSPNARVKALGGLRAGSLGIATLAVPTMLGMVTKWLFGYDDKDEDALRRALPDYQRENMLAFGPKMDGKPSFIDVGFMNPYSTMITPFTAAFRAGREHPDDAFLSAVGQFGIESIKPFASEQLLLQAYNDTRRNQYLRRNGQPLYNNQALPLTKAGAIIPKPVLERRALCTLDSLFRVYKGVRGDVTPGGRAYDPKAEAASMMFGTKWQVYDPAQSLQSQTAGFESQRREATNLFNAPFTNRGTVNSNDVYNGYKQANAARKQLTYEMRQSYSAPRSWASPRRRRSRQRRWATVCRCGRSGSATRTWARSSAANICG